MPGFRIQNIGGNGQLVGDHNARFYTSYSWELTSLFVSGTGDSKGFYDLINSPVLMLRTCSLPQTTFDKVETEGATIKYKYAGNPQFEDVRLSWYDTYGFAEIMKEWLQSVYARDTGVRVADNYKKNTKIRKYLADRDETGSSDYSRETCPSEDVTYELFGSWPIALKESELTYLEASIKSIELTVTYDDYEVTIK